MLFEALKAGKANLYVEYISILLRRNRWSFQDARGPKQPTCQQVAGWSPQRTPYWELNIIFHYWQVWHSVMIAARSVHTFGSVLILLFCLYSHFISAPIMPRMGAKIKPGWHQLGWVLCCTLFSASSTVDALWEYAKISPGLVQSRGYIHKLLLHISLSLPSSLFPFGSLTSLPSHFGYCS